MKLQTRDFGIVEIDESSIITFKLPILGFEEYKRFALLHDEKIGEQFVWLQSVDEATLCFIMFDPTVLSDVYQPALPKNLEQALGGQEFLCWVLMTIGDDLQHSTVNLKSPIFINMKNHLAGQVVLEQKYPVRFQLVDREERGKC